MGLFGFVVGTDPDQMFGRGPTKCLQRKFNKVYTYFPHIYKKLLYNINIVNLNLLYYC